MMMVTGRSENEKARTGRLSVMLSVSNINDKREY